MALSREQVADALYQAGFRGQDLVNMVAIAGRESGYKPDAHRTDRPKSDLSGDMGLFQINYVNWPLVSRELGLTDKRQLFDPVTNARAAKVLHDQAGYSPWTAGPGGWTAGGDPFYGTNRSAAQEAVNRYTANPGQYSVGGGASASSAPAPAPQPQAAAAPPQPIEAPNVIGDGEGVERTPIEDYKPPEVDPEQQAGLTNLLEGFGIDYPNAPRATPQLLAYLRGLGMQTDTIEDQYDTAIETIAGRRDDARGDLAVSDQRRRRTLASDAQRRGALVSGATNSAFARQAEDVARSQADINRQYAEGSDAAQAARDTAVGNLNQQALEQVLDEETRQAVTDAQGEAQVEALRRAREDADYAFAQQRQADQRRINAQVALYNQGLR